MKWASHITPCSKMTHCSDMETMKQYIPAEQHAKLLQCHAATWFTACDYTATFDCSSRYATRCCITPIIKFRNTMPHYVISIYQRSGVNIDPPQWMPRIVRLLMAHHPPTYNSRLAYDAPTSGPKNNPGLAPACHGSTDRLFFWRAPCLTLRGSSARGSEKKASPQSARGGPQLSRRSRP